MKRLFRRWLDTLWPPYCLLCGQVHSGSIQSICLPCLSDLPRIDTPCWRCGLPIAFDPKFASRQPTQLCGNCLKRTPSFHHCVAPWLYDMPVQQVINGFKHKQQLVYGRLLADLLARRVTEHYADKDKRPTLIIPVPLHQQKLRKRGFNQALEIAKIIARNTQIPLDPHRVQRCKPTTSQQELTAMQRRRNVRNAFVCRKPFQGECVAIVDDVVTTGATCDALASVLSEAGAGEVHVWAVARTLKHPY